MYVLFIYYFVLRCTENIKSFYTNGSIYDDELVSNIVIRCSNKCIVLPRSHLNVRYFNYEKKKKKTLSTYLQKFYETFYLAK